MLIHIINRISRVCEILRRLEQASYKRLDEATNRRGDSFESFALLRCSN